MKNSKQIMATVREASGYGYDKASAAITGLTIAGFTFVDSGTDWSRQLRDADFNLSQAL